LPSRRWSQLIIPTSRYPVRKIRQDSLPKTKAHAAGPATGLRFAAAGRHGSATWESQLNKPLPHCPDGRLSAIFNADLPKDSFHVVPHRMNPNVKRLGDFTVSRTLDKLPENIVLSLR
jgi:hypothetical protein